MNSAHARQESTALARATVVLILSYMMRSVAIFLNMAILETREHKKKHLPVRIPVNIKQKLGLYLLSYGRFNLFFFCLCLIPLVCSHATSPNFVPAIGMGEVHRVGTAINPLGASEFTAPNVDKRLIGDEKEEKHLCRRDVEEMVLVCMLWAALLPVSDPSALTAPALTRCIPTSIAAASR